MGGAEAKKHGVLWRKEDFFDGEENSDTIFALFLLFRNTKGKCRKELH